MSVLSPEIFQTLVQWSRPYCYRKQYTWPSGSNYSILTSKILKDYLHQPISVSITTVFPYRSSSREFYLCGQVSREMDSSGILESHIYFSKFKFINRPVNQNTHAKIFVDYPGRFKKNRRVFR